jgi:acylphosphatase
MSNAVRFVFIGEIDCASFVEFANHRARRLDLRMAVGACDHQSLAVTVSGHDALVDMFEMACSLGPYNCIVRDVTRSEADLPELAAGEFKGSIG